MTNADTALSMLVPMFNEREGVGRLLRHLADVVPALGVPCELLIIDDGSTDGTAETVAAHASRLPWARLLQHATNQGKGAALRTGLAAARYPWVFYTDADLPVDLHRLREVLTLTADADLIVGYRTTPREGWRRAILSSSYNVLVRTLFGLRLRNIDFPFKLFRRSLCDGVRLTASDFFFDTELVVKLHRCGCRIREVAVPYQPRRVGASKVLASGVGRNIRSCLWQLWRLRVYGSACA